MQQIEDQEIEMKAQSILCAAIAAVAMTFSINLAHSHDVGARMCARDFSKKDAKSSLNQWAGGKEHYTIFQKAKYPLKRKQRKKYGSKYLFSICAETTHKCPDWEGYLTSAWNPVGESRDVCLVEAADHAAKRDHE